MNPTTVFPIPSMRRIHRIHFIGVGGSGMSGIAEVLATLGYKVSGSDQKDSLVVQRLRARGVDVFIGHDADNVKGADVVVVSTAISQENVEYAAAKEQGLPMVQRAAMLAELMRFRHGIAVAGTHGKTTTTSFIVSIFAEAGFDPTYVVGGVINQAEKSAQLGKSRYFVVEADESDASFLHLQPMTTVVTNIDLDHMDTYDGDPQLLEDNFVTFVQNLPFYGLLVCCIDDARVQKCLPRFGRPFVTYGFSDTANVRCVEWTQDGLKSFVRLERDGLPDLSFTLNVPGKHNVLNAMAAACVAHEEGVADEDIVKALGLFQGVNRRFTTYQKQIEKTQFTLVDDYGHHPEEIDAVIQAARLAWPERKIKMVFQPHRYSRTRDLYEDFVRVLSQVDEVIMLKEYSAGEAPIVKADAKSLCASLRSHGHEPTYVRDFEELAKQVRFTLQENDVVIFQGAGDIGRYTQQMLEQCDA
ncbi:MAG: UDP-N-acetylmuramate--L-alanine ligase [Pseudomonadota bacterium]|nr:UDP-N-acetylmuramate--L-alanine ligase [Pseudomonadota bacterium]